MPNRDLKKEDDLIYKWRQSNDTIALRELVKMNMCRHTEIYKEVADL